MQGNDANMAPFKLFIERTEAAWKKINSLPISSLEYSGDMIDKYKL